MSNEPQKAEPQKTFYLETFGCQMNAHDSEKVVGTLVSEGYRQVSTVEEAGLVLYNTCSIRDKAEQKAGKAGKEIRRAGLCCATGGRKDFRACSLCFAGLRLGIVPQFARDAGAT
jgi:hypothetical protein